MRTNKPSITRRSGAPIRRPARVHRRPLGRTVTAAVVALVLCAGATLVSPGASAQLSQSTQALDGAGNNRNRPDQGRAGTAYTRLAPARYADGRSAPVPGPNSRFVSNRIFNDVHQNLFSENGVSQWGFTWGQFLDHTFGLRDEAGTVANIPFNAASDPLEDFTNTLGVHPLHPVGGHARHRRLQHPPADQHGQLVHRRLGRVRRHQRPPRLAAGREQRRQPQQQQRPPAARRRGPAAAPRRPGQRGHRAGHGHRRAAHRPARPGHDGRRRAGQREHRAGGDPHAVRPRAQPHRRAAAGQPQRGHEVRHRPADRDRRAAVRHLQRVPPGHGDPAAQLPGLQPERQRQPRQRVRHGRLPGPQHDPRRDRARGGRGALLARAADRAPRPRASR